MLKTICSGVITEEPSSFAVCRAIFIIRKAFGVKIIDNPYDQSQRTETYFTYINVDEFKESLPSWLGRNYDYVNDRATEYYDIPGIDDGEFEVTGLNSYSSYHLHFQVCMNCVVVNFNFSILD